jgi:hypothetical protein
MVIVCVGSSAFSRWTPRVFVIGTVDDGARGIQRHSTRVQPWIWDEEQLMGDTTETKFTFTRVPSTMATTGGAPTVDAGPDENGYGRAGGRGVSARDAARLVEHFGVDSVDELEGQTFFATTSSAPAALDQLIKRVGGDQDE